MKQFYETYKESPILSALLRELSWTNNLLVMSRVKTDEEGLFYIRLATDEKYSSRERVKWRTVAVMCYGKLESNAVYSPLKGL
jgi:hypothetical protein